MRKMRKNNIVTRLLAFAFACVLAVSSSTVSKAAELTQAEPVMETEITPELEPAALTMPGIQPYGVLEGYGSKTAYGDNNFTFYVNGSWSPYAGCTVKTSGFTCSSVAIGLYDASGACKASMQLSGNDEKRNYALFNVSPGLYTVRYALSTPCTGSVYVWVY